MSGRDPSEPIDAYEAFLEYRALPPSSRSLGRLVKPGRSITTLKRMSLKWAWQRRIEAFEGAPAPSEPTQAPAARQLARVTPLPGCVPAEPDGLPIGLPTNDGGSGPAGERADVCTETGDLLEHVERVLRQELGRAGAFTTPELLKLKAAAEDIEHQRRLRDAAAAQVDYDLSQLTDDEAGTLRALCAKARTKAGVT